MEKYDHIDKENIPYTDFSNVETEKNFFIPEDLPEGPYGSPRGIDTPVQGKSGPWKKGNRPYSAFNNEFKSFHQDLPREYPGAHPTHDDGAVNQEPPYDESN
ncbi:MAG: cytosolic protein [Bacillus sp. (in: Bacteria)]|nr:cytosolic protein [Bacillus sp. (in: firmicutes)]